MAKVELTIVLDKTEYHPGETLKGRVEAVVEEACTCDRVVVTCGWSTVGRGDQDKGGERTFAFTGGGWRAGERHEFSFEYPVPEGPPSYAGKLFTLAWQVRAEAEMAGLFTMLVPGSRTIAETLFQVAPPGTRSPGTFKKSWRASQGELLFAGLAIAGFVVLSILWPEFGLPLLIVVALFFLFRAIGWIVLAVRFRDASVRASKRAHPGGKARVDVDFGWSGFRIQKMTATLVGREWVAWTEKRPREEVRVTDSHELHRETIDLAQGRTVTSGEPFFGEMRLPERAPITVSLPHAAVLWSVEVTVYTPPWGLPWIREEPVEVVPLSEKISQERPIEPL